MARKEVFRSLRGPSVRRVSRNGRCEGEGVRRKNRAEKGRRNFARSIYSVSLVIQSDGEDRKACTARDGERGWAARRKKLWKNGR
jgi:adenine-specific DNA methylase